MVPYVHGLYLQFRRFPTAIRRFYFADIWFALSRSNFGAIFNLHLMQQGYTASQIGLLHLVASLSSALLAIPIGFWTDRIGRRRLYVCGSLPFAFPYLVLPFCSSFPAIVALNTLGMVGLLMAQVNETPLLAAEVRVPDHPGVFSIMMVNFMFWNIIGTQLNGFTVKWWGTGISAPYMPALILSGICGMITGGLCFLLPFRKGTLNVEPTRSYLPSRIAIALALISLFSGGFTVLFQGFSNVILVDRYHLNEMAMATTLTIANIAGWTGAWLG